MKSSTTVNPLNTRRRRACRRQSRCSTSRSGQEGTSSGSELQLSSCGASFFSPRDPLRDRAAVPASGSSYSLLSEQHVEPTVAPARSFLGELPEALPKIVVGRSPRVIALSGERKPGEAARSPLRDPDGLPRLGDRDTPLARGHHFFPRRSFTTWRFSAWSATIRFKARFSSSSCLSRLAAGTSSPPYFLFHR